MKTLPNDPIIAKDTRSVTQSGEVYYTPHQGLTKLEYAAIQAMKGILANGNNYYNKREVIAEMSVTYAKALFNELNKNEQDEK